MFKGRPDDRYLAFSQLMGTCKDINYAMMHAIAEKGVSRVVHRTCPCKTGHKTVELCLVLQGQGGRRA